MQKKVPKQQLPNVHACDNQEDDSIHFTIEHESDQETNTELKGIPFLFLIEHVNFYILHCHV